MQHFWSTDVLAHIPIQDIGKLLNTNTLARAELWHCSELATPPPIWVVKVIKEREGYDLDPPHHDTTPCLSKPGKTGKV